MLRTTEVGYVSYLCYRLFSRDLALEIYGSLNIWITLECGCNGSHCLSSTCKPKFGITSDSKAFYANLKSINMLLDLKCVGLIIN